MNYNLLWNIMSFHLFYMLLFNHLFYLSDIKVTGLMKAFQNTYSNVTINNANKFEWN